MAPHSCTLAWKIPQMEEPGRLQSMGLLRVRHDWMTSLSLFTFTHWRWNWQPTPVFLPGESQGRGSLVGCRLWGRTESDTTEVTLQQQQQQQQRLLVYKLHKNFSGIENDNLYHINWSDLPLIETKESVPAITFIFCFFFNFILFLNFT